MNMSGTALYEGCVVLFIAQIYGLSLSLGQQATLLGLAVLSAVATKPVGVATALNKPRAITGLVAVREAMPSLLHTKALARAQAMRRAVSLLLDRGYSIYGLRVLRR